MGGKILNNKAISTVAILLVAFFVLPHSSLAFSHPDVTSLEVNITSPPAGAALKPGFTLGVEINDATADDIGGEPLARTLFTKNGDETWIGRGGFAGNETFVNPSWCDREGTSACGVRIRAVDTAGHFTQAERFFTIDTTPPKVALSSNRSDPTQKTDAEFRFAAFDEYGVDRIECGLNGLFQPCISSRSYSSITPDGEHIFAVRAFDKAGNSAQEQLRWTIDSTPPSTISTLSLSSPTYFSEMLNWLSPQDAERYDIRYSAAPINSENWNKAAAIVRNEPPPKPPGSPEIMRVGPENDAENSFIFLRLGDISNILSANIRHYFAVRARDENWNWSAISNIPDLWTNRDPCDYDADRLYSPLACGPRQCDPAVQSCDFYDFPPDFGLEGNWPPDMPDDDWIRAFGAAAKDLDQDGEAAAGERTGAVAALPRPQGRDWYDNPFTDDLVSFTVKPTLKQLSDTINDLDLDTFISQSWKEKFGSNEPSEPVDEAELRILSGENIGGLIYPDAGENTCFNCTAYDPDSATGRIPAAKTTPSTNQNRAVGQIEAYYTDLAAGDYETISRGTIDPDRPVRASSANCRDGLDNDLDKGVDSSQNPTDPTRDLDCPTTFEITSRAASQPSSKAPVEKGVHAAALFPDVGIVQCGRDADDFLTPIDESAPCNICSFFQTVFNIKNLVISRLMPLIAALAIVAGGLMIALSRGSVERYNQGRKTIVWAISAYAATLLAWTLISLFFILIGATTWTGLAPEKGEISGGWWTFTCELGEPAIADFSAAPDGRIAPYSVDFTDLSPGEVLSWSWDFGDGATSSEQSPRHTYTANNSRTVTLAVNTADGTGKKTKTVHFEPEADFIAKETGGRVPLAVQFEDKSTGEIDAYSWDFDGDNREDSSEQNPTFLYTRPGPYRVKLTVWGPGGRDTESKVSYIFAYPKPISPIADMSVSVIMSEKLITDTQNFSLQTFLERFSPDLNPLNPNDHYTGWEWDFGNEWGTSAVENPTYFYETSREPYEITLKALGPGGEHSTSTTVAFPPRANFSADKTSGVFPQSEEFTVNFSDNSLGTVSGWSWSFGDGNASTAQNPAHKYQSNGLYTVALAASGPKGRDSKSVTDYIAVSPRADFSAQNCTASSGCALGTGGTEVEFTNKSACSGACSWYWEFGDGQTSSARNPSHTYAQNDIYTVRLTATGLGGSHTAELANYIRVAPRAEIAASPTEFVHPCGSDPCPDPGLLNVSFSDSSQGVITDLSLAFGDGEVGAIAQGGSTSHSYPPGTYTATLTARDHNGLSSEDSLTIEISQEPPPPPPPPPEPPKPAEEPAGAGGPAAPIIELFRRIIELFPTFLPF